MEIISSHEFREMGREARELRQKHAHEMSREQLRAAKVQENRSEVHAACESLLGGKIIRLDNAAPTNVAGYYTPGTGEISSAVSTLDDKSLALHTADHEGGHDLHFQNGVTQTNFEGILSAEQTNILGKTLHMTNINGTNWMEGFNEKRTIQRRGRNSKIAYLQHEVPAAERLDALCIATTGRSLQNVFHTDGVEFYDRLKELCDRLLEEQEIKNIKSELIPLAA